MNKKWQSYKLFLTLKLESDPTKIGSTNVRKFFVVILVVDIPVGWIIGGAA